MRHAKPAAEDLAEQVKCLEDRVRSLRLGRRILMNIVYAEVTDRQACLSRLRSENRRLQQANARYAHAILESRNRIMELEAQLLRLGGQSTGTAPVTSSAGHSSSS
ncbi:MAG: translation initiation factor 2 [Ignavibacteriales bacterium]